MNLTKDSRSDARVKAKHVSWKEYVATFSVLTVLASCQPFLFGMYQGNPLPAKYIVITLIYWGLVSFAFCMSINTQRAQAYDRPMRKIGEAAKQVAEGDFSVYLEPLHTAPKYDYVDIMFTDFNKMVEELGSIETLKNDFIANVSHELKTPIAVVQNYAQLMRRKELSTEERVEYCDTIIGAAQRLTDMITNILKLNQLEHQEIIPSTEPYDLCSRLCDCVLQFDEQLEKKEIKFITDMEDRVLIRADRSMLDIVWNNLLSNALKFTDPGGCIEMRQASDEECVTVRITDTGCGMSDEVRKHIYDQFYQGDTSRATQGNGLGLALVHRVVERCGGTISVSSVPEKGTAFTVTLPKG